MLVDDFLASAQQRIAGARTVAVLQFAHAEEVAPLAAFLGLTGDRRLGSAGEVYGWVGSSFRTAATVPLSSTIDGTLWRSPEGSYLVSVAQNEIPTTLGLGCRSSDATAGHWGLDELRRCLAPR